jgi:hypothetical protein
MQSELTPTEQIKAISKLLKGLHGTLTVSVSFRRQQPITESNHPPDLPSWKGAAKRMNGG